ncbi:hypothetical protein [Collinsella sp. Sow4_E3]
MRRALLLLLPLLAVGCSPPATETQAPAAETVTVTTTPTPSPTKPADPDMFRTMITVTGAKVGKITDNQLLMAGWAACRALDDGGGYEAGWKAAALLLMRWGGGGDPDPDLAAAITLSAAQNLCPTHRERVFADAQS